MPKWADYCITRVRYDGDEQNIESVKVRTDTGDELVDPATWSREDVVQEIESGSSFMTVTTNANKQWVKGEKVRVIKVNGDKFIRTDANKTESDNLGDLPTF